MYGISRNIFTAQLGICDTVMEVLQIQHKAQAEELFEKEVIHAPYTNLGTVDAAEVYMITERMYLQKLVTETTIIVDQVNLEIHSRNSNKVCKTLLSVRGSLFSENFMRLLRIFFW